MRLVFVAEGSGNDGIQLGFEFVDENFLRNSPNDLIHDAAVFENQQRWNRPDWARTATPTSSGLTSPLGAPNSTGVCAELALVPAAQADRKQSVAERCGR